MQLASARLEHWPSVVGHLSSLKDLDPSARRHGALVRKRGVRGAADLLHLGLLYSPGGLSRVGLRATRRRRGSPICATSHCLIGCPMRASSLLTCWTVCWRIGAVRLPAMGGSG
jgi:hypothetical protein